MNPEQNGHVPLAGYEAPIFTAMTHDKLVAGVPRPLLCIVVTLCVGLWLITKSLGVIGVYVLLHAICAYLSWRDPQWPQVLKESLQYRYRIWRLGFTPAAWRVLVRVSWLSGGAALLAAYLMLIVWR